MTNKHFTTGTGPSRDTLIPASKIRRRIDIPSPKDYRDFAFDCIRWAHEAKSPTHQQFMLDQARNWMRIARVASRSTARLDEDKLAVINSTLRRLLN